MSENTERLEQLAVERDCAAERLDVACKGDAWALNCCGGDSLRSEAAFLRSLKPLVEAGERAQKLREAIGAGFGVPDNHGTAHPIFMVEREVREYGYDFSRFDGDAEWVSEDECIPADAETAARLEQQFQADGSDSLDGYNRVGYRDRWEAVMPFFTRAGAEAWIARNKHNHRDLRVFVDAALRNYEWQAVREFLAAQPLPAPPKEGA